jgi:hypothetical protein
MSTTQTVYVVDEDGATFWSVDKTEAEAVLVREAWTGAVHLTITEAEAPTDLPDDALTDWIIANVPPTTCEVQ